MSNYNNTYKIPTEIMYLKYTGSEKKTSEIIVPKSLPPYLMNLITFEDYLNIIHQLKFEIEEKPKKTFKIGAISLLVILILFFIPFGISFAFGKSMIGFGIGIGLVVILGISLFYYLHRYTKKLNKELEDKIDEINSKYSKDGFSLFKVDKIIKDGNYKIIEIYVRIYHHDLHTQQTIQYSLYQGSSQNQLLAKDNDISYSNEDHVYRNL